MPDVKPRRRRSFGETMAAARNEIVLATKDVERAKRRLAKAYDDYARLRDEVRVAIDADPDLVPEASDPDKSP